MAEQDIINQLKLKFGIDKITEQKTRDHITTVWIEKEKLFDCMSYLKTGIEQPYKMLYDLTAIDERTRSQCENLPESDFSVVYHLFSFERNTYLRIKSALKGDFPSIPSVTSVWPCANWNEIGFVILE